MGISKDGKNHLYEGNVDDISPIGLNSETCTRAKISQEEERAQFSFSEAE